jgi:hypothetical protein
MIICRWQLQREEICSQLSLTMMKRLCLNKRLLHKRSQLLNQSPKKSYPKQPSLRELQETILVSTLLLVLKPSQEVKEVKELKEAAEEAVEAKVLVEAEVAVEAKVAAEAEVAVEREEKMVIDQDSREDLEKKVAEVAAVEEVEAEVTDHPDKLKKERSLKVEMRESPILKERKELISKARSRDSKENLESNGTNMTDRVEPAEAEVSPRVATERATGVTKTTRSRDKLKPQKNHQRSQLRRVKFQLRKSRLPKKKNKRKKRLKKRDTEMLPRKRKRRKKRVSLSKNISLKRRRQPSKRRPESQKSSRRLVSRRLRLKETRLSQSTQISETTSSTTLQLLRVRMLTCLDSKVEMMSSSSKREEEVAVEAEVASEEERAHKKQLQEEVGYKPLELMRTISPLSHEQLD